MRPAQDPASRLGLLDALYEVVVDLEHGQSDSRPMQRFEPGSPGASSEGRPAELAKSICRLETCTICSPSARPRRFHSDQAEYGAPAPIADLHTLLNHGAHEPHLASLCDKLVACSSGCLLSSGLSPNDMCNAALVGDHPPHVHSPLCGPALLASLPRKRRRGDCTP